MGGAVAVSCKKYADAESEADFLKAQNDFVGRRLDVGGGRGAGGVGEDFPGPAVGETLKRSVGQKSIRPKNDGKTPMARHEGE